MSSDEDTKDANKTNRKKAPDGFYARSEAEEILGLSSSTFGYYVEIGRIKRTTPPGRKEGFYNKEEIDRLATELALALHTSREEATTIKTRVAQPRDAEGIVSVLTDMGWPTATAKQRRGFYRANPYVDYVVTLGTEVMGYINAAPYTPEVMEAMLAGKMRSWQVQPADIMAYERGKSYGIYVGIATRKNIPNHTQRFGFRLIAGFLSFLEDLARQEIFISRLYAASDQPDGMKLCQDLGFELLPRQEGDLFNRYCLDMETSPSMFAQRYRAFIQR